MADDFRNTYLGAGALGSLTPGGTANGNIELANDGDIFAISLIAGRTYTFDMQGASSGFTVADPSFYLRNSVGTAVGFSSDIAGASTDDRLTFTVTSTGTYYVDAFGGGGTGTYQLRADNGFIDDYRDTYADTNEALGNLVPGGTANGNIELANDGDIFAISLIAGRTYTFDMQGASSGFTVADPSFYLRNSMGTAVGFSSDIAGASTDDRLTFTVTSTGTYYVDAFGGGGTGTYRIAAAEGSAAPDDYRDTYNDAAEPLGLLPIGGSRAGSIGTAGDRDVFAVSLVAGQTYTFDLGRWANGGVGIDNAYLTLFNGTGAFLLANNDFNSSNARITYTATTTGTFYLDARSATTTGTGNYAISARTGFDDSRDVYNGSGSLATLAVNGALYGTVETAQDTDVFAVSLVAGQTYTFDLTKSANGGVALDNAYLTLFSGTGAFLLANNDFNSSNARITYTATTTGTFYLDARSATTTGVGNYAISARSGFDDLADTITDPASPLGIIAAGQTLMGTIETAGDSDVFRFNLVAGHTYSLGVEGGAFPGLLDDADLQLFNSAGTLLAYNDDANGALDPEIVFTANATGVYYADISGVKSNVGTYSFGIFELI